MGVWARAIVSYFFRTYYRQALQRRKYLGNCSETSRKIIFRLTFKPDLSTNLTYPRDHRHTTKVSYGFFLSVTSAAVVKIDTYMYIYDIFFSRERIARIIKSFNSERTATS